MIKMAGKIYSFLEKFTWFNKYIVGKYYNGKKKILLRLEISFFFIWLLFLYCLFCLDEVRKVENFRKEMDNSRVNDNLNFK